MTRHATLAWLLWLGWRWFVSLPFQELSSGMPRAYCSRLDPPLGVASLSGRQWFWRSWASSCWGLRGGSGSSDKTGWRCSSSSVCMTLVWHAQEPSSPAPYDRELGWSTEAKKGTREYHHGRSCSVKSWSPRWRRVRPSHTVQVWSIDHPCSWKGDALWEPIG